MSGRDVPKNARVRLQEPEEERQKLSGRGEAAQVPVDPGDELCNRLRFVDLQMDGGVHGRHEERCRHSFAGNVGDEEGHTAARQREDVVVIAADVARRNVRGRELHASHGGQRPRENLALNRGGELELPFDPLLLDRVAVQPGGLDRRGGLVGEERQQPGVGRREVEDASVARLLVRDRQKPEAPAGHGDRDREALLASGQALPRRRHRGGGVVDDGFSVGDPPGCKPVAGENLPPEVALVEDLAAVVEEDERALAGVRQRDRPEEDLVRERGEVELAAEGEAEVVERLELEQPRPHLELRPLDLPREAVRGELGAERDAEERRHVGGALPLDPGEAELAVDLALRCQGDPERLPDEPRVSGHRIGKLERGPSPSPAFAAADPAVLLAKVEGGGSRAAPLAGRVGEARGERRPLPESGRSARSSLQRRAADRAESAEGAGMSAAPSGRGSRVADGCGSRSAVPALVSRRRRRPGEPPPGSGRSRRTGARPMIRNVLSIVGVRAQNASTPFRSMTFSSTSIRIEMPIELTIRVFSRFRTRARAPASSCAYACRAISSPPGC